MGNYSKPIAVDLKEGGRIYISHEDVNGTGQVEIRWFQKDQEVATFAAPHYETVFRLIEVLLWAAMAARKIEQTDYFKPQ